MDGGHAAFAETTIDGVAAFEGAVQAVIASGRAARHG
jgi:hypothetical protein